MEEKDGGSKGKMLVVIRITGDVNINGDVRETLNRLRLRRKYGCVVFENAPTKEQSGMIERVKDFVAFGNISSETLKKLKEKRGTETNPGFFRLHPPRGGARTKVHFPKGILGNNGEKINNLIERML